jgi:hypothetical protein
MRTDDNTCCACHVYVFTQVHADVVTNDVALKCLSNILSHHLNITSNNSDDSATATKKSSSSSSNTVHKKKAKTTHTSTSTSAATTATTTHDDETIALLTKVSLCVPNMTKRSVLPPIHGEFTARHSILMACLGIKLHCTTFVWLCTTPHISVCCICYLLFGYTH